VYHRRLHANGYIERTDDTKRRDIHKVRFFWGKYADIPHKDDRGKWMWCDPDNLRVMSDVYWQGSNQISMIGNRSLDRLIRKVCCIARRSSHDGSDIVINYGNSNHHVPENIFTVNRTLLLNKYEQTILLREIAPESTHNWAPDYQNWILKPMRSFAGRGIMQYTGSIPYTHYIQRRVNKVREFRAHVFLWNDEMVPMINEKRLPEEKRNQLCWNEHQGATFFIPYAPLHKFHKLEREEPELLQRLKETAVEACKRLHYDFGGVDLAVDDQNNIYVFEVNSRMGIKERSLWVYKHALNRLRSININHYKERRGW